MNRQQRRAAKKSEIKHSWHGFTKEQKMEALFKNGITADDLKHEYNRGFSDGFHEASPATFKTIYAAICLALNDKYGFGKKRCIDALNVIDQYVINSLTSAEAIEEVYKRIGIQIDFKEPFDRITELEAD